MDLIEESEKIDLKYWYYQRKFNLIERFFQSRKDLDTVCDVGAGQALFSIELSKNYPAISFIATDINYSKDWLNKSDICNLRFSLDYYPSKLVLLNDVIEHVEQPILFLNNIVQDSARGTFFLITVPAFEHLWSSHDEYLNHFRRYRRKTLKAEVEAAGLVVMEMRYLYWSIYPFVLAYRKIMKSYSGSNLRSRPILDKALSRLMTLESVFPNVILPGISIWCVAIKP